MRGADPILYKTWFAAKLSESVTTGTPQYKLEKKSTLTANGTKLLVASTAVYQLVLAFDSSDSGLTSTNGQEFKSVGA